MFCRWSASRNSLAFPHLCLLFLCSPQVRGVVQRRRIDVWHSLWRQQDWLCHCRSVLRATDTSSVAHVLWLFVYLERSHVLLFCLCDVCVQLYWIDGRVVQTSCHQLLQICCGVRANGQVGSMLRLSLSRLIPLTILLLLFSRKVREFRTCQGHALRSIDFSLDIRSISVRCLIENRLTA